MRLITARCAILVSLAIGFAGCSMPTMPKMKWPSFASKSKTNAPASTYSNAPTGPALASTVPQGTANSGYSQSYANTTSPYAGAPYPCAQAAPQAGTQYPVTPYPATASNTGYYPPAAAGPGVPAGGYMPPSTGPANPYAAQPAANPYAAGAAQEQPYTANQYNNTAPAGSAPYNGAPAGTYTR